MGDQHINQETNQAQRIAFMNHLLHDVEALEKMLSDGSIESGITRIGAEQELCLLTPTWRPAKTSMELLEAVGDPHFTTELARYNLEINLDPMELKSDCFSRMESDLRRLLQKAQDQGKSMDTTVLLTGILPTITKQELEFEFMTPSPRYWALNDVIKQSRGANFLMYFHGVDELSILHDSVLFEACNTSFQLHLQIDPDDFISSYNWAQAITGPIMSVCTNSPLLLGRELWSETRIALFQQSIDTRKSTLALVDQEARVSFGSDWETGSIAEIYKSNISKHHILLDKDIQLDSLEVLKEGGVPKLEALNLHNGTVYRWNRPCYGVGGGKAHTRIENRYIPSGPTVLDEMANFAFWVGLMVGRPPEYDEVHKCMDFKDAKSNFIKAARTGKDAVMNWMGKKMTVSDLVINELLPIAREGLKKMNIDREDAHRLLDVIEKRTLGSCGSDWQIRNYRKLRESMKEDDALVELTRHMQMNASSEQPVHTWPDVTLSKPTFKNAALVSHVMSTKLFTMKEKDLAEMATTIMRWKNIHHVPVENDHKQLTGLLTWTHVQRQLSENWNSDVTVEGIMTKTVETVHPKTSIEDAIKIMKANEYGCLPVVDNNQLVGIITIKDVIDFDRN